MRVSCLVAQAANGDIRRHSNVFMDETPQDLPDRLDSWKAIAAYLQRDERTVQRWERELGLPVRRVPGGRGRSVFAYLHEIEAWLKTARQRDAERPPLDADA